jgi:hypothetical protein
MSLNGLSGGEKKLRTEKRTTRQRLLRAVSTIEPLENRLLMSVIPVTNLSDSGAGSLRAAIMSADAMGGTNTITFTSTLTGTIPLASPLPTLTDNMTIIGPSGSPNPVTVNGELGGTIFTVTSAVTAAEMENLTISGADSTTDGGGINNSGTFKLLNCTVSGDTAQAPANGGGIYNSGTLDLVNSTISGDQVQAPEGGGGLYNRGYAYLVGCTVSGDGGSNVLGGGIDNNKDGTVVVNNDTISGNSGSYGAGILNRYFSTLIATNSDFTANNATGYGGAVKTDGHTTITNCIIDGDNTAGNGGAGIACGDETLHVYHSTISQDTASNGGGINISRSNGSALIVDCTITDDTATTSGGGIFNNYGQLTVTDSNISNDQTQSGDGGGISNHGLGRTLIVGDSNISDDSAGTTGSEGRGGGIYSIGDATISECTINGDSAKDNSGGLSCDQASFFNVLYSTISNDSAGINAGGAIVAGDVHFNAADCTFYGDRALQNGRAIDNYGSVSATNCTIVGDGAGNSGGGIYANTNTILNNTIVAENFLIAGDGPNDIAGTVKYSASHNNLVGSAAYSGGLSTASPFNNKIGYSNASLFLGSLNYNGGPTRTVEPEPGSPAINAGNPVYAISPNGA